MINNIILIFVIVLAVILSGLFSGAETGIYQLSQLRLRLGTEKKQWHFSILTKIMRDSPGLLIAILIGTNLTVYIVTSIVTYSLMNNFKSEHTVGLVATVLTAPLLFIFAELIPKSLFFYRADYLTPRVAPVLFVFKTFATYTGIVPLFKAISAIFTPKALSAKPILASVQKHHLAAIIKDTREEAFLSPIQLDIINRLIITSNMRIAEAMIPIGDVRSTEINSDKAALLGILKKTAFTRILIYEGEHTNYAGFINIYDCLSCQETFSDLRRFLKPLPKLPANMTISEAINTMQNENRKIMLVTSSTQKPLGIITMKDLAEQLLGELAEW